MTSKGSKLSPRAKRFADGMRKHYDFSKATRNPHAPWRKKATLLAPASGGPSRKELAKEVMKLKSRKRRC